MHAVHVCAVLGWLVVLTQSNMCSPLLQWPSLAYQRIQRGPMLFYILNFL